GIRDFHVTGVQTCALPIFAIMRKLAQRHQRCEMLLTDALAESARQRRKPAAAPATLERMDPVSAAPVSPTSIAPPAAAPAPVAEIGRASCRDSVWVWAEAE